MAFAVVEPLLFMSDLISCFSPLVASDRAAQPQPA